MKKSLLLLLTVCLILGTVLALSACGKKKKLPETDYEKVVFAFEGVEKSFQNGKGQKTADLNAVTVPRLLAGGGDPLSTIRAIYEPGDDQGDVIDELEYDQPPMIQFQCLKAVLEKIGSDFAFGVKYYDDMTGEVFFDPETGEAKDAISADATRNQYKYDYLFRLSLRITLDENDDIKADVSFDIRLTRENEEINTHWYVNMFLDYDMTSTTPLYTLAMRTANDEKELPHIGGCVYEYDYVDMKADGIAEWRKFVLQTDAPIIMDEDHPDFASYRNAGIAFTADTCKWYYADSLKKITRRTPEKDAAIADAFFDFGLNGTAIDAAPFVSAAGERNGAIKTAYGDFSAAFRKDVIYSLVTKRETRSREEQRDAVGIQILTEEGEAWGAQTIERDCTLSELLSGYGPWGQGIGVKRPCVFTVDANGNRIDVLRNFGDYDFEIIVDKNVSWVKIELGDRLSDVIADKLGGMEAVEQNGFLFTIRLTNKTDPTRSATFSAIIGFRSEIEEQEAKQFPAALTALGVPEYETGNGSFKLGDYKEGQDSYSLTVKGTKDAERAAYLVKLSNAGFIKDQSGDLVKLNGERRMKINVSGLENGSLTVAVRVEMNENPTYTNVFPAALVAEWVDGKFTIPTPTSNLLYAYDADDKYIYLYGMGSLEAALYVLQIGTQENVKADADRQTFTTFKDGRFYTIEYAIESNNAVLLMLDLNRLGVQEPQMSISVNGGAAQPFWPDAGSYTTTVTLAANDAFTISTNPGILEGGDEFFDLNAETHVYTVKTGGVYTFMGDPGILRVTKN